MGFFLISSILFSTLDFLKLCNFIKSFIFSPAAFSALITVNHQCFMTRPAQSSSFFSISLDAVISNFLSECLIFSQLMLMLSPLKAHSHGVHSAAVL